MAGTTRIVPCGLIWSHREDTMDREQAIEQQIRDLAAALESVVAAILVGERDPKTARQLLTAARDMAAAIRTGADIPPPAQEEGEHEA